MSWLHHLKKCCADSQQPAPLVYFVSGTPLGDTPADIRPALSLLEKDAWREDGSHPLRGATLAAFDDLTATFDRLRAAQESGDVVPPPDIADYRRRLDRVLKHTMVRRLGTDRFRGRNLTDVGPLRVNIIDHHVPASVAGPLQALADRTRELVVREAAAAAGKDVGDVGRLLRSRAGEELLLKLRLAATFPGIAGPSGAGFAFTRDEVQAELARAGGRLAETAYFAHIPEWAAHSPKLETINKTVADMLADRSKIPGEAAHAKKYCIFCPLEAEAMLVYGYLLLKRAAAAGQQKQKQKQTQGSSSSSSLKPVWLHSGMTQEARQRVLDGFLRAGNAPPNVLVAPMALAGTGLNLQRARYATVTGPAWARRDTQQAYYRIHRVGQKQDPRLQLLTARWNPAERAILARYESAAGVRPGRGGDNNDDDDDDDVVVGEGGEEAAMWEVSNRFCSRSRPGGGGGGGGGDGGGDSERARGRGGGSTGLVDRHQAAVQGE